MLSSYDSREVRKGIDTLKKRIDKHFGDVDDPANNSRSLITRVLEECAARYAHAHDRMKAIVIWYMIATWEMEWLKEEASAMFKR